MIVTMVSPISMHKIDATSHPTDYDSIDKSNKQWFEKHKK